MRSKANIKKGSRNNRKSKKLLSYTSISIIGIILTLIIIVFLSSVVHSSPDEQSQLEQELSNYHGGAR